MDSGREGVIPLDDEALERLGIYFNDINLRIDLVKEIDRLNNIINELEKWLKEYSEKDTLSSIIFGVVLNHLIDLKGEKNEKD